MAVGVKRSGTGVATLLDKVLGRNAPGWRGASVVLVAATLAAWLTVEVVAHWLAMERAQERHAKLQQTADALAYQAMGAGMLGAVSLLGLSEPLLKDMARGTVPPDHPAALAAHGHPAPCGRRLQRTPAPHRAQRRDRRPGALF